MVPAPKAGLAYFVIVFSRGFLLGTFRVLLLVPAVGERIAVLSELPVILGIAWISSRLLIARFDVAAALIPRLSMSGLAFGLLMICEFITGIFVTAQVPFWRAQVGTMNQVCGHACTKKRRQMRSSTATDLIHGAYLGSYESSHLD